MKTALVIVALTWLACWVERRWLHRLLREVSQAGRREIGSSPVEIVKARQPHETLC